VVNAAARLDAAGLAPTGVDDTVCCFAEKTETWVTDPDGVAWEWYVKTADQEPEAPGASVGSCCA
jgi:hypothetical protein